MPSALPAVEGAIRALAVETPYLTAVPNRDLAEVCSTLSSSPLTMWLHYRSVTSCFSVHYLPAFCISLNVFTVWTIKDLTLLWRKSTQCQISATPGTNKKHMSRRQPSILTWWHLDFSLTVWRNMFNMWDRSYTFRIAEPLTRCTSINPSFIWDSYTEQASLLPPCSANHTQHIS